MAHVLGDALDTCCKPFKGKNPYGEDVKYDPIFDTLRTEVQKLTALSTTEGGVNWETIKTGSLELLTTKTKDLTVASYLALSLFMRDGYPGLADGLAVVDCYLRDHWEGIFPPIKKMRVRVAAMEWLVDRVAMFVDERAPEAADADVLAELGELVPKLGELVGERLAHEAPGFGELIEGIRTHIRETAPPPEPAAEAVSEAPAEGSEAAQASAPAPAPAPARPATPAAAPAAAPRPAPAAVPPPPAEGAGAGELLDHVLVLIAPLRAANFKSPVPYRLLRSLRWDTLAGPPPADPGSGKTRIPPPRSHLRTALEAQLASGSWQELLEGSEGAFQDPSGTFWLDLQRYTATALEQLGADRAAAVVKEEVSTLLERFRDLPHLSYSDETPFASDPTRAWLDQLRQPAGIELPAAAAVGDDAAPSLSQEEVQKAMVLFGDKSPAKAFAILQQGIERAGNPRARFRTRLLVGRVCLQANQPAWARTLLEELVSEMGGFSFEQWERETAVELLQLLAVCYGQLAKNRKTEDRDAVRAQLEAIRSRLFRLDMRAAAAVDELVK